MLGLVTRILQGKIKKNKSVLPNPNFEYRLIFRKGAVETIKKAKGWRTDADMARALGLTRAYIAMLHRTKVSVTATVITRLAAQMGNTDDNWWIHYEIVPWGVSDLRHPVWNEEKYQGRMPYGRYSSSAELRKRDYKTETLG
jgi:transcriptional regulator with XRE-family HTH domain